MPASVLTPCCNQKYTPDFEKGSRYVMCPFCDSKISVTAHTVHTVEYQAKVVWRKKEE